MKFKTPLHITGTPEQLKVVEEGLIKLGYIESFSTGEAALKTTDNEFWGTCFILPFEDETRVHASNPELVLALAAQTGGEDWIVGEWLVYLNSHGDYVLFQVKNISMHCDYTRGYARNGSASYRKATKEEIIKHFNMAHFGDTKVPLYTVEEREIIGYKWKNGFKNRYEVAACLIANSLDLEVLMDGTRFKELSTVKKNLQEAGVLDLWFEPVYKKDKEVITLRHSKGTFEVEVSKEGIFFLFEERWVNPVALRNSLAARDVDHSTYKALTGCSYYEFTPSEMNCGCLKKVPVEDIQKVLDTYDSLK